MDYQNRAGSKFGGGGVADKSAQNLDRRERLRRLALETIDLAKDPYYFRNHLGTYECKLCLTVHVNDGSYLTHTQGKKHQQNLARRAAREARDPSKDPTSQLLTFARGVQVPVTIRKNLIKIGRPGYKVTKIRDPATQELGLRFQLHYPEIGQDIKARHRFMSSYEQKKEQPDKRYQYVLIAAEPYETIAFRVEAKEIDRRPDMFWDHWDRKLIPDAKTYTLQFFFYSQRDHQYSGAPGLS